MPVAWRAVRGSIGRAMAVRHDLRDIPAGPDRCLR